MDDDHTNFYQVRFNNSAVSPCGQSYSSNGNGCYVMCSDAANQCLWSVQVPASLGQLYLAGPSQLRFRGWFDAPIQVGAVLFDPGDGTCYVDGAIDPTTGLSDGIMVARASYKLYGASSQRMLRSNGRVLLAVNYMDSVRLGSTLFATQDTLTVLAEFYESGELAWQNVIGSGILFPSQIDEDLNGNILLAGSCLDCIVGSDTVHYEALINGMAGLLAKCSSEGEPQWLRVRGDASLWNEPTLVVRDDGAAAIGYTRFEGQPPDYFSLATLFDPSGTELNTLEIATSTTDCHTPQMGRDADGGFIMSAYYVGGNPDQRVVKTDSDMNAIWTMSLNQGGNFWSIDMTPVGTDCYLATGGYEFGLILGSHNLGWTSGVFLNYFIAKLCDTDLRTLEQRVVSSAVRPNPTSDQLTMQLRAATPIRILDAQGRIVQQSQGVAGMNTIDVRELRPGPYVIAAGEMVTRFVKE